MAFVGHHQLSGSATEEIYIIDSSSLYRIIHVVLAIIEALYYSLFQKKYHDLRISL